MNIKIFWQRYRLAVYLLLLSLSIIFGLIGITLFREASVTQSLFLNLATEVGGAVLLFFIIDYTFSLNSQEDISEQLKHLSSKIEDKQGVYFWEKDGQGINTTRFN